jgi:hypothetical protein
MLSLAKGVNPQEFEGILEFDEQGSSKVVNRHSSLRY